MKELGLSLGLTTEDAYRIVQLAAFNTFEAGDEAKKLRENLPESLAKTDELLLKFQQVKRPAPVSIQEIIAKAQLRLSSQLEASEGDIQRWNKILEQIFQESENLERWNQIFLPSYLLRNEAALFQEILGI